MNKLKNIIGDYHCEGCKLHPGSSELIEYRIKALMLELADECTHPGETDRNGIGRFHENGIIDPVLLRQKVEAL